LLRREKAVDVREFQNFLLSRAKVEREAAAKATNPIVAEAHRAKAVGLENHSLEVLPVAETLTSTAPSL
jgi:hypothetical protein